MTYRKKVSLKEVAKAAGVSSALVSMVLNGKGKQYGIGEEATNRVLRIAKEMDYQPNIMARGLRSGKSNLIGLVVADIANPFFAALAREIEITASKKGYTVIYGSSDEKSDNFDKLIRALVSRGVDGVIAVPCEKSAGVISELADRNLPMVMVDRYFPELEVSAVVLNNVEACSMITEHLIEQGYKKISYIAFNSGLNHVKERIQGYEQCMAKAGLSSDVLRIDMQHSREEMQKILHRLLAKERKTDALIFSNNTLTIEGLYILKQMNIRIPEDVAVMGYDGGEVFDLYTPPISYVKQPIADMGREAVNVLIEQMETGDASIERKVVVAAPNMIITSSSIKK